MKSSTFFSILVVVLLNLSLVSQTYSDSSPSKSKEKEKGGKTDSSHDASEKSTRISSEVSRNFCDVLTKIVSQHWVEARGQRIFPYWNFSVAVELLGLLGLDQDYFSVSVNIDLVFRR